MKRSAPERATPVVNIKPVKKRKSDVVVAQVTPSSSMTGVELKAKPVPQTVQVQAAVSTVPMKRRKSNVVLATLSDAATKVHEGKGPQITTAPPPAPVVQSSTTLPDKRPHLVWRNVGNPASAVAAAAAADDNTPAVDPSSSAANAAPGPTIVVVASAKESKKDPKRNEITVKPTLVTAGAAGPDHAIAVPVPQATSDKGPSTDKSKDQLEKRRRFICKDCKKSFCDSSTLTRHRRSHTKETPFKCKICLKAFTLSSTLTTHVRTHTGERPYKCKICAKSFVSSGALARHRKTHKDVEPAAPVAETVAVSSTMNPELSTAPSLTATVSSATNSGDVEKKGPGRPPNGVGHVVLGDDGKRRYGCNECDKEFSHQGTLKVHMRTHTGEKPFTCNFCAKRFARSWHLVTHVRSHTGERPYKCEACGTDFMQSAHLRRHRLNHCKLAPMRTLSDSASKAEAVTNAPSGPSLRPSGVSTTPAPATADGMTVATDTQGPTHVSVNSGPHIVSVPAPVTPDNKDKRNISVIPAPVVAEDTHT